MARTDEMISPKLELWIGLVELRPLDRKTHRDAGAFTTVVTWAFDVDSFQKKAEVLAAQFNMFVAGIEQVQTLIERREKRALTEEVEDMVFRAESNPNALIYGTFYTYRYDEA
jgi:hypothetical protein